jgi:hypothetical protein
VGSVNRILVIQVWCSVELYSSTAVYTGQSPEMDICIGHQIFKGWALPYTDYVRMYFVCKAHFKHVVTYLLVIDEVTTIIHVSKNR